MFDTGADRTCLNPRAMSLIGVKTDSLENPIQVDGIIGRGKATFYRETTALTFFDADEDQEYTLVRATPLM